MTVEAPVGGTIIEIAAPAGTRVNAGDRLLVIEVMKMEHDVIAEHNGVVTDVRVEVGAAVDQGQQLVVLRAAGAEDADAIALEAAPEQAIGEERADLRLVRERHEIGLDAFRPEAVAKRREKGRRTARENLADLLDDGSFVEYGPMVIAAQERRRSREELIERTPADGLVGGIGTVDGQPVVAMSYDYTVLAGTQGFRGHLKKERLFEVAKHRRLPVILFAEGGGGRPGDVDWPVAAGLDGSSFDDLAELSGCVPLVGITSGYCFAGNAVLLGCCDVIIATEDANIGMGGPAMIEGGGLGRFEPHEVGPFDVQWANGVIDLRAKDDPEAVAIAKRYLGYFLPQATAKPVVPDQTALRDIVPTSRKRHYRMHDVLETLFDVDSVLELRADFAAEMITAFARVDGRPLGVIANNAAAMGGAIQAPGADKAARFMELCDAFRIPLLTLVDTPGFMVGPDAERGAIVRHFGRMFVTGASLTVPCGAIAVRKAYGLGAQAMTMGGFRRPQFMIGWPTSEFGAMNIEGAVKLAMRRELEAIADPAEREQALETWIAEEYERGRGVNLAAYFEIDDAIDPADSRKWISTLVDESAPGGWRDHPRRRHGIAPW